MSIIQFELRGALNSMVNAVHRINLFATTIIELNGIIYLKTWGGRTKNFAAK
jgi:hypothetical protein